MQKGLGQGKCHHWGWNQEGPNFPCILSAILALLRSFSKHQRKQICERSYKESLEGTQQNYDAVGKQNKKLLPKAS